MHRTITINSVVLKNTQTKPQNIYFSMKQIIFRVADKTKKVILEEEKNSTFRKITVVGFVNQLIKTFWPKALMRLCCWHML